MNKETLFCPTCGKPTTFRESPEWLLGHFSGHYAKVLAALIAARRIHRGLTMDELIEATRNDGDNMAKPADRQQINSRLTNNAEKLKELGWVVMYPKDTKLGYWLAPIEID